MAEPKAQIEILDKRGDYLRHASLSRIATGFKFTEGPVWHPGGFLLFSDTPANRIFRLLPDGRPDLYLDKSGGEKPDPLLHSDMIGSNGLAVYCDGSMLICQHGNHALSLLDKDRLSIVTDRHNDRPFNSPNDLVVAPGKAIYFSDPPYGLADQKINSTHFQRHAGIYRYHDGNTELISTALKYPNGLCLSPGGEFLYVSSNHFEEPGILQFILSPGGPIGRPVVFMEQNADGIKMARNGNLFLATDQGIMVVSPYGKRLALIQIPEMPTNLAWEGDDNSVLYVTARTSVYKLAWENAIVVN